MIQGIFLRKKDIGGSGNMRASSQVTFSQGCVHTHGFLPSLGQIHNVAEQMDTLNPKPCFPATIGLGIFKSLAPPTKETGVVMVS